MFVRRCPSHSRIPVVQNDVVRQAQDSHRPRQLYPAHRTQGFLRGRAGLPDFPLLAQGGGNQPDFHPPRRVGCQRPAYRKGFVVRMGKTDKQPLAGHR